MVLSGDNITSIIVAIITALSLISAARYSKRPGEKKKAGDDVAALLMKLAECEEIRDRERGLFFEERQKLINSLIDKTD